MRVLITGSNSDMARALTFELVRRNDEVILTYSSETSKKTSEDYLKEAGLLDKVSLIEFNFKRPQEIKSKVESLRPDALVMNAWKKVDELKDFHEFNAEEIASELDENIKANILLLQYILPNMIQNKLGRILFISSVAATSGTSKYGLYCLGKSALEGLISNIAVDYGKYNITANTLRPGIIKTERTRRFWEREFYAKRMSRGIPMAKLGEPEHIARACLPFLDEDTYITGSSLNVSGGLPLINTSGALKDSKDKE